MGAPVAKGRPRFVRKTGVAYTPGPTRAYETQLRAVAQREMDGRAPLEGPLMMRVVAHMPIPVSFSKKMRAAALAGDMRPAKRPDADNYFKIAADALNTIVFHDDAQIVDARIQKRYAALPALVIEIGPAA